MDNLAQTDDEIRDLKSINTGMIQKLKFKHIEACGCHPYDQAKTHISWATPPQRMIQMVSKFEEFACCFFFNVRSNT